MEILVSIDELSRLLSRALGAEVTNVSFIPEDRVIIGTNLDILGISKAALPRREPLEPPISAPLKASFPVPTHPEASPEEMADVLSESRNLEGLVYEYFQDGEITTRERNESESNLPPGEPIIYVRSNRDE